MIPTGVWILNKSNQNPPGQPGGGSPGEGYLKCVQSLKSILNWFIESVAPERQNNSRWEQVGQAESVEKSWKTLKLAKFQKILTNNNQVKGLF